jgi:hypothetical protein
MTFRTMRFLKATLLLVGLSLIAALVGCSSSSSSKPSNTPTAVAATSGSGQSVAVGGAYTALSATVTNSAGAGVNGVSVVFSVVAGSSGATASFATGGATDTETTNTSGVATTSQVLTAGTVAGAFTVTATVSGVTSPATFTETNTATAAATLAATSGGGQTAAPGAAFANPLVATVTDSNSNPVPGVSVTFTAPATGASGTFASNSTGTESDTTDANGVATSSAFTANSTAGGPYNVVASSGTLTPVNFAETNTAVPIIGNGTYVYHLRGLNNADESLFYVSGVVTVSGNAITGGEQDYIDFYNYSNNPTTGGADQINPTGSVLSVTADGNVQLVLTTCLGTDCTQTDTVLGVAGVETINAAFTPNNLNKAVIIEFDSSASASGELDLQNATAAAATPAGGFAFGIGGFDYFQDLLSLGGVINVDGPGTISGTGSIFDANNNGYSSPFQSETFTASTVSAPDSFGRVVFTLNPSDTSDFPQIVLAGYIIDSSRISLVETADAYVGTTGGIAFSQGANTGTFSSSSASVSGVTYVVAVDGFDNTGALQAAGTITLGSGGAVTGFLDFNDLTSSEPTYPAPDPFTATSYSVDPTGDVTIPNLTDNAVVPTTTNVQLYLDGSGNAVVITLDATDVLGGDGIQQTAAGTDAAFTGNYAMVTTGWDGGETGEVASVGPIAATGTGDTLTGTADINWLFTATYPGQADAGTYAAFTTAGILSPSTITGLDVASSFVNTDAFNFYQIDAQGDSVAIETDDNQLTLGAIAQQ